MRLEKPTGWIPTRPRSMGGEHLDAGDGREVHAAQRRQSALSRISGWVFDRGRPAWHDNDDAKGAIKIVRTGDKSDPLEWQPHIRSKARRKALAKQSC